MRSSRDDCAKSQEGEVSLATEDAGVRGKPLCLDSDSDSATPPNRLLVALVLGLVTCALLWQMNVSQQFPFYFMFDMDLSSVTESLSIQSGKRPDIIMHPGFGMYVIQTAAHWLGVKAGILPPVLTYAQLNQSPEPLLVVAALTDFFRSLSPVLAVGTALFLWMACLVAFRPARIAAVGWLAVLLSLESFSYQCAFIRSELYSVFFWSIAVFLLACSAGRNVSARISVTYIVAGCLLGLSMLTKIQVLFLLAVSPLLHLVFVTVRVHPKCGDVNPPPLHRFRLLGLALVFLACILAAGLLFEVYRTPLASFMMISDHSLTLSPLGYALLILLGALLASHGLLLTPLADFHSLWTNIIKLDLLCFGFVAAFLSPLLVSADLSSGWEWCLLNLRLLFFDLGLLGARTSDAMIENVSRILAFHPIKYILFALSLAALGVAVRTRRAEFSTKGFLSILSIGMIAIAGMTLGYRPVLRDGIWVELVFGLATITALGALLRSWRGRSGAPNALNLAVVIVFVAGNVFYGQSVVTRIDAEFSQYGWGIQGYFSPFFGNNDYNRIMETHYSSDRQQYAAHYARDHRRTRRLLRFVFTNAQIDLDAVGRVAPGMRVWTRDSAWQIHEASPGIVGSHGIDPTRLALKARHFLLAPTTEHPPLDRFIDEPSNSLIRKSAESGQPGVDSLSLLGRRDLDVLLFVDAKDYARLPKVLNGVSGAAQHQEAEWIALQRENERRVLYGLRITDYAIVPISQLQGPYLVLIRERGISTEFDGQRYMPNLI